MRVIDNKYGIYPAFQAEGFAARFAIPFAKELCHGYGVDIGCHKEEWMLPGAIPVDPAMGTEAHALNLPTPLDYIFSSHCLEHLPNAWEALDYWHECLTPGGLLFLYLPHPDQEYWMPWNNHKHLHILFPAMLQRYFESRGMWTNIFVSGRDLNHSFYAVAQKRPDFTGPVRHQKRYV